jgi:predicted DsbA family dithiol-disulfide isomerase
MLVEIWSDVVCPWCYVGKRRFESALNRFEHKDEVEVVFRSFELDPSAPAVRDGDLSDLLAKKYGMSVERAKQLNVEMTERAAVEGIDMHFEKARSANSFDAHRLLQLAKLHGVQDAMKERLMKAYFSDGELISDRDTLRRLATEVGLDADEVLATDAFAAEVREDEQLAASIGIQGVPFYAIDRAIGATGAQEPEVLLDMLREVRRRESAPSAQPPAA